MNESLRKLISQNVLATITAFAQSHPDFIEAVGSCYANKVTVVSQLLYDRLRSAGAFTVTLHDVPLWVHEIEPEEEPVLASIALSFYPPPVPPDDGISLAKDDHFGTSAAAALAEQVNAGLTGAKLIDPDSEGDKFLVNKLCPCGGPLHFYPARAGDTDYVQCYSCGHIDDTGMAVEISIFSPPRLTN